MAPPPRLLLCEGPEDVAFFQRLIETRSLPRFRIRHTGGRASAAGGNSRFGSALKALKLEAGVKDILIVADNDEAPDKSFANVCRPIQGAYGRGKVPDHPLQKASSNPSIMVVMIPWKDELGCLETLCVEASRAVDAQISSHVDHFAAMIGVENWDRETRKSKMWLRSMLAACCERDPFVFLGNVFRDKKNRHLIPLDHRCFDRVSGVLSKYGR